MIANSFDPEPRPTPGFLLAGREAPRHARAALLVLLLSSLAVASCAAWMREAPPRAPHAAVAASVAPDSAVERLALRIPVEGLRLSDIRDNFGERRGKRIHGALDILAPRGTPVVAAVDGRVARIRNHPLGGLSVYQIDASGAYALYYAHLDSYAPGLAEGARLARGDPIGRVGTTGNAPPRTPHLHFALVKLGPDKKWYNGTPVNPYPFLVEPDR